ncbi:DUF7426 family protein [Streptomyces coffeae]|uniref:DUF7426 domain-containing protein n=1 Tax=Streptomyces coffeae TaxID=621382 RepID=A0ABS1NJG5_9ACTN|nr:hypothetical protein [Streptomyces coffeae]MBL1100149.1 hypothetical protein [Streptomyces coffeae]
MAARFEALDELFDDALELPIQGKTYRIPSPSAEDGLRVQRITTLAARLVQGGEAIDTTLLDDDEERDLLQLCLGPVFEQLREDGVNWSHLRHAGLTAMFWIVSGIDTAEQYWKAAGDPSQLAPNRAERRAKAKKNGSAAVSATKRRGSTSGTSGRKGSGKGRKAATT